MKIKIKEPAVEVWWAIKNFGAKARDEPRFATIAVKSWVSPILFTTRKEAEGFRCRWFARNSAKTVRVEVREL